MFTILAGTSMIVSQNVVDFEELPLEEDSYWNGSDESGNFISKYLKFYNSYDNTYNVWQGFAYSNKTDVTTADYTNQFSAASGSGVNNSENFAVAFIGSDWENNNEPIPSVIKIDANQAPSSYNGMYISLNTYASLYMADNDFYKNNKHWLKLHIQAINSSTSEEMTKDIIIADYRSESNGFNLSDWTYIDMSWADGKDSINFTMSSDDIQYGSIYTPTYFCIDNFGDVAPDNIATLTVEAKEVYDINKGESINIPVFVKGGVQPYTFEWNADNTGLDNYSSQTPEASPEQSTVYQVDITDAKGETIRKEISVIVSTANIPDYIFENLTIHTNQNSDIIISNSEKIDAVDIYDITGKLLISKNINSDNIEIQTGNMPNGIYMVNITCGSNKITKKIIK